MKIKLLPHEMASHLASKLLPVIALMRSLVVRLAGWQQGSPSGSGVGSRGPGLVLVLVAVAARLRESTRGTDLVARFGGDVSDMVPAHVFEQLTKRLAEREQ